MNRARIAVAAAFVAALPGCAGPGAMQAGPAPISAAWFSERPEMLSAAARAACRGPGEEFARPGPGVSQCRLLLDPETTAAVILAFDGLVEDLPRLVVSLSSARSGDGYLVTGCAFLKVPQPGGAVLRVAQADREVDAKLREMLMAAGGQPVREVPAEAIERCFSL